MLSHYSSHHRKFYRANLLSCWVYSYLLVGLWYPLHLTYASEWLALTSDLLVRKAVALISNHVGPNPTVTSEWPTLTSYLLVRKVVALISNHIGPNPTVTSEWPALTSDLLIRKAVALTSM